MQYGAMQKRDSIALSFSLKRADRGFSMYADTVCRHRFSSTWGEASAGSKKGGKKPKRSSISVRIISLLSKSYFRSCALAAAEGYGSATRVIHMLSVVGVLLRYITKAFFGADGCAM